MKFILISPKNRTTYNFRGDLLNEIIKRGYEVVVTGPDQTGVDKIKELGVRFVLIPLDKTGLNILADLKYILALTKLLRVEKPDITLGYTIKPVIYGAIAAKLSGVKYINSMITGIGYTFTAKTIQAKLIRLLVTFLYRIGFKYADTVIFQNRDDLNDLVCRKLLTIDKCRVVNGSGVNMQQFRPAPFPEKLTFFMLSRVMYSKGIVEYLEAAKTIKVKYPEVRFMLLGALENIQDSLTAEDLKPYIDQGIIEHFGETEDVTGFYHQCSVYVLPSHREGTPRTVLEAMAMGRPVITTNAPGCRETVIDKVSGFLVPVRDSAAVADKMEWFIENPDQIEKMGRASYEYCQDKYDVQKINKDMLKHMDITGNE